MGATPRFDQAQKDVSQDYIRTDSANGFVDVVNDYSWTLTPQSGRVNVPYILLTEYSQNRNKLFASLNYWANQFTSLQQGQNTPYTGLYSADPTGWSYKVPYLSTYDHQINNTWIENDGLTSELNNRPQLRKLKTLQKWGNLMSETVDTASDIYSFGKAIGGKLRPKTFSETAEAVYDFNFFLYNTLSPNDVVNNWNLLYLLKFQNLSHRANTFQFIPPVFYEVLIPGVRYCPAAIISALSIEEVGNKRVITKDDGFNGLPKGDVILPDAYKVSVQITELIPETRNIIQGVTDPNSRIHVTTNNNNIINNLESSFINNIPSIVTPPKG